MSAEGFGGPRIVHRVADWVGEWQRGLMGLARRVWVPKLAAEEKGNVLLSWSRDGCWTASGSAVGPLLNAALCYQEMSLVRMMSFAMEMSSLDSVMPWLSRNCVSLAMS